MRNDGPMAGIDDPNVVDLVAQTADGGALLVIVKEGPWAADRDVAALSVKLNWYVNYVVDGGLVAAYPELVGRPVTVQIFSNEPAPDEVQSAIELARHQLHHYGVSLTERVVPLDGDTSETGPRPPWWRRRSRDTPSNGPLSG